MQQFSGYAIELEQKDLLLASCRRTNQRLTAEDRVGIPDEVSTDWQRVENQARMNSCGGNALSTVAEVIYYTLTATVVEWSRMFCYLTAQRRSGIRGDRGVTIQGAVRASQLDGFVPESAFPYPSSYSPDIPAGLLEQGQDVKVLESYKIEDTQDAVEFIANRGAILAGIPWLSGFAQERDQLMDKVSGRPIGGHAIAFCGYKKCEGAYWPELTNSHGTSWAKAGRSYVAPEVFDWMLANGTIVGLAGLTVDSQPLDWKKNSPFA